MPDELHAWTCEDPIGNKPTGSYTSRDCDVVVVLCSNEVTIEF
jgi:hypothetical protein